MNESFEPSINPLKKRLDSGKPAVGVLMTMPSVNMAQVLASAGFDWLFIDMEHGSIGIESAYAIITATNGTSTAPIVRVPWNLHWLVKPVLDAGAMGVVFPMIRSAREAEAAARAVRYPPTGDRGFAPFYASLRFGASMMTYADPADREILCIVLIEHKDAVEDIDRIVEVDGVDVCHLAPFDLAMSYGYREGVDHPEVQDGIARVEEAVLRSGKHLGGLALDADAANAMIGRGYRQLISAFDLALVQQSAAALLEGINRD
jgi:4-hydroxy-2-oxoheptanedioate aldolase